ncbi:MAG TPA: hypothetical protein VHL98_18690 [Microvirga sp.]|jgi:hypothetical protein|nr:hypothetical protein [Microvirga sp.]
MEQAQPEPTSPTDLHRQILRLTSLLQATAAHLMQCGAEKQADLERIIALEEQNRTLVLRLRDAEERASRAEERMALVEGAEKWRHLYEAELARRRHVRLAA